MVSESSRRYSRPGRHADHRVHAIAITTAVGAGCPLPMHWSVSRDSLRLLKLRESGSQRSSNGRAQP